MGITTKIKDSSTVLVIMKKYSRLLLLVQAVNRSTYKFEVWFARGFVFTSSALLVALSRSYKKIYVTVVDSTLLSHLAIMCYLASTNHKSRFYLKYIHAVILLPFTIFSLIIVYRIAQGIYKAHLQWLPLKQWKKVQTTPYNSVKSTGRQQRSRSKTNCGTLNLCFLNICMNVL